MATPTTATPPPSVYLVFSLAITPQSVTKLLAECANWANQRTEIHLLFASTGGNVDAGICAYNVLRSLPVKVITYNVGNVDSIANIIFLAGHERFAVPHATFMFHGVAFDWSGNVHGDQPFMNDKLETIQAGHKKMASIIMERAKFDSIEEILALFSTQATKEAEYALARGITHKIQHLQIPEGNRILVFSE